MNNLDFEPDPDPNDPLLTQTSELAISTTFRGIPTSIVSSAVFDQFTGHDGDLDNDGVVCQSDWDAMGYLAGNEFSIGCADYNPRADFDLNGIIDTKDRALFTALYQALPDENENGIPDACE